MVLEVTKDGFTTNGNGLVTTVPKKWAKKVRRWKGLYFDLNDYADQQKLAEIHTILYR